jgi:molybdenum cofactor cytidylyltransferase
LHIVAHPAATYVGILLAAGRGTRFDPAGHQDKLRQTVVGGGGVAVSAARSLLRCLPQVIAVVRPGADDLANELRVVGCTVVISHESSEGMAHSLTNALRASIDASGWVIALGDMPWIKPSTISALVNALSEGAAIATPVFKSRRGNPIAFSRKYLNNLLALTGDEGARRLLRKFPVVEVDVDDAGVILDIDTPSDLMLPKGSAAHTPPPDLPR